MSWRCDTCNQTADARGDCPCDRVRDAIDRLPKAEKELEEARAELRVARELLGLVGYRMIQELKHSREVVLTAQELVRNCYEDNEYPERSNIRSRYLNDLRDRLYKLDAYQKEI